MAIFEESEISQIASRLPVWMLDWKGNGWDLVHTSVLKVRRERGPDRDELDKLVRLTAACRSFLMVVFFA
jgi:hypothetical protein